MTEFTSTEIKVKINKEEEKEEKEMTYKGALKYIIDNLDDKFYFNLKNKEINHDCKGKPISTEKYFISSYANMFKVDKIAIDKIKFINEDDELSIDTTIDFYEDDNLQLDIIDKHIKLSSNGELIFSKIKAVLNLLNEIYNSLNEEQDFINAYYKFYNNNEEKAIPSIISVIKVFQSLQKLIFDLIDDYKENCHVMNSKKINSILNSIIDK